MKITLLGLCGLIAATGLLKAGLDHLRPLHPSPPVPAPRAPADLISPPSKATVNRAGLSEEGAARCEWTKRIGSLRLIKRNEPQFEPGVNDETISLKDAQERTVARVTGHSVHVELVRDLTGDRIPELVLCTWSGGAYGSFVYYVYSTGERPRCLVAYWKRMDDYDLVRCPNFEVKDLDGDGRQEIVTTYDGFALWGDVREWETSNLGAARVPMVLGLRRGRYVDVTRCHRAWLRAKLRRAESHFSHDLEQAGTQRLENANAQGMIEYYSVASLLHGSGRARRMTLRRLPQRERALFLANYHLLDKVLDRRRRRLAYPTSYGPGVRSLDAEFRSLNSDLLQ